MDPARKQINALQQEMVKTRDAAVKLITRKNMLAVQVERLTEALQTADGNAFPTLQKHLEKAKQELAAAEELAARAKEETRVMEEELSDRMASLHAESYPPENRERVKKLLIAREKAIADFIMDRSKPTPGQLLNREVGELKAQIHEARSTGNDSLADSLVPRLDEVLEELDAKQPIWQAAMEEKRRKVTAEFDEELESLKCLG